MSRACAPRTVLVTGADLAPVAQAILRAFELVYAGRHCPLSVQTKNPINGETLALMRKGAVLVNTARGGLVDEHALIEALRSGQLSAAGLDTFSPEPPPAALPLRNVAGHIMTLHTDGVTTDACRTRGIAAAKTFLPWSPKHTPANDALCHSTRSCSGRGDDKMFTALLTGERPMKTTLTAAAIILPLATFSGVAVAAEHFPAKPIRMIVPYPPGGGTDIVSRLVGGKLTEVLGAQVIIDNRGGAGGTIGLAVAATASADGHTIVMGQTSNLAIGPALYKKLTYDALRSFAPVSLVDAAPLALSVSSQSSYRSVRELIAASKSKPDGLTFASPGNGTVAHLTGELLRRPTGMQFVHVPYKGAAQAIPDLIAGRADFYISSLESAKPHMQSGKIRVLAVTSAARAVDAPDIPTIAEAGYKGFEASTWWGILVPAGTPAAAVNRLAAAIEQVLKQPDINKKLGGDTVPTGPQAFAQLLKADHAKWAEVVKRADIKTN